MSSLLLEPPKEASTSYDEPMEVKTDQAWYNLGIVLMTSGQFEEAIASFDKVLEVEPGLYQVWYNQGIALGYLKRFEEAIANFDKALEIKPDFHQAWYNRGIVLHNLACLNEALASYNKALEIKPDKHEAWYWQGTLLYNLGCLNEAVASYNQALEIKPDFYQAWNSRGSTLGNLGHIKEAVANFDKAIEIKPDLDQAWYNRGIALFNLGRLEEAIASYNKAIEFKPDYHEALYNKACCYALQGDVEQALENLQQAISLSPDEYREMAKAESDFDSLREDERFQALIQEESDEEKDVSELRHNVSWEEFENILVEMGDNRSSRLAYDQGTLEITMPSQKHEYYKEIIRDLIKYLAEELDLDCESLGSTTWKRKDLLKGAEPDNCFYIQNEPAIRGVKPNIDLSKDPPPDLILEVDHTSPSLNRLPIYAALGVPEIWIYDMKVLCIYQLEVGKYKETDTSIAFGTFPIKEIPSFIKKNITASPRELRKSFRAWVGQYLIETPQETEWEDGEIDEHEWLRAATSNPAFDFLKDPDEDIYTLADGKPFND